MVKNILIVSYIMLLIFIEERLVNVVSKNKYDVQVKCYTDDCGALS